MLKRFTEIFACLLLVLMPLQAISATHMSICNSMMKLDVEQNIQLQTQQPQVMSCHKDMASTSKKQSHSNTCKTSCAALCASLFAMAALPSDIKTAHTQSSSQIMSLVSQAYASITQPNLQRPPILLA